MPTMSTIAIEHRRGIREAAGLSLAAVGRMARVTSGAVKSWETTGLEKNHKARIARERLEATYAWLRAFPTPAQRASEPFFP